MFDDDCDPSYWDGDDEEADFPRQSNDDNV